MAERQGQDNAHQKEQEKEGREEAFVEALAASMNVKAKDKLKKSVFENEEHKEYLAAFLHSDTPASAMFVLPQSADTVQLTTDTPSPDKFKRKGFVMLRMDEEPLRREGFSERVIMVELTKGLLEQMHLLLQGVLGTVMQNPANQAGWSDLVTKDLMEHFNEYTAKLYSMMGLTRGKTWLSLPSRKVIESEGPEKEKAHIFEVCLSMWTRQIKAVLKLESEQALKNDDHPGPLVELEFWQNKSLNLNSIHEQLQSVEIKGILRFLERSKSTYTNPFAKLQKEIEQARVEANDNSLFLATLRDSFELFRDTQFEFTKLLEIFAPMMHNIFLIYKHSKFYCTPPRLLVLIRMICNAIITKAADYVSGEMISALIGSQETHEACERLQNTIDVCEKFKEAYFEYKAKSNGEWKLTLNALFVRLDQFIDRCHDILHLTSTILQFSKLERIELGGTKGESLTETIKQIYDEFNVAVESYKSLPYDTLDIKLKTFDEDIFKFRNKIKDLERRLSSVIVQAFDDNDAIMGKFRLLDIFETILLRPIIQDELEKKHLLVLDQYRGELKLVQEVFFEGRNLIEEKDPNEPISNMMPPVAGSLLWCHMLLTRIREPFERIPGLGQGITEREEYRDVDKLYHSIVKSIELYMRKVIEQWEKDVNASTEDKLQNFLLTKNEQGTLRINFDPALVRLLREVKYMKQLSMDVIPTAEEMFVKSEVYRRQIVSLDLIVQNYNKIITCLTPVEKPLVKARIENMDKQIEPGITTYRWKSPDINQFISSIKEVVDSLYDIVDRMKKGIDNIENELKRFRKPFIDRKNKPLSPEEYDNIERAVFAGKIGVVKEAATSIHKLLKEISDAVKADRRSLEWKNYTENINMVVLDGISAAVVFSLNHLNEQVAFKKNENPPLFEIKLELEGRSILFEPEIRETNDPKAKTVRDIIKNWMFEILSIAFSFPRMDIVLMTTASGQPQTGDFTLEIKEEWNVRYAITQLTKNMNAIEAETQCFRNELQKKYSYLWTEDAEESFNNFLEENTPKQAETNDEDIIRKENPLLKGCRERIPDLEKIDEKIVSLKFLLQEVNKIKSVEQKKWLRIDLRGFIRTLEQRATQWIRIYTEFLRNEFRLTLENTKGFIKKTNQGIRTNPADVMNELDQSSLSEREKQKNRALLMKVMKHISEVKDVNEKFTTVIQRMKAMVLKLKKHGISVTEKGEEEPLVGIENANNKYMETSKKVFQIKADILQLQTTESIEIKKKLDDFHKQVEAFRSEYKGNLPYSYDENATMKNIMENYGLIDTYFQKLKKYEQKAKQFSELERLFELEHRQYKPLKECLNDLVHLKIMWDLVGLINYQYEDWKGKLWRQIKVDLMIEQNKVFQSMVKTINKEVKLFKGYPVIQEKVANMNSVLACVELLFSGAMGDRHWAQLKTKTNTDFDEKSPSFTFADVLDLKLYKFSADVNEIVDVATKEGKIEKKLKVIEVAWSKLNFQFQPYKEMFIFAPIDNMMEILDIHSLDLMGMKAQGKYVEFFKDTVDNWREKLGRVYSVADEWLKVQKNWRILVNIFLGSEDIRMQLPEDTKVFESVHSEFVEMMAAVHQDPLAIEACTDARKQSLVEMSQKIKKCEKSLNDYLEQKKKIFPRFYFLSNQSLLTILSNGQNPPKVAEFIGDCFDGLKTLRFVAPKEGEIPKQADGMISKDGEIIPFESNFVAEGQVEVWLKNLERKMREELYLVLANAKASTDQWETGDKPREEWLKDWCAQMALLSTVIVWTEDVNRAFEDLSSGAETAMKECGDIIVSRIRKLINKVTQPMEMLERMKYINVITIDVHGRDVVQNFVNFKVQEAESFNWQSQLKFEWTYDKSKEAFNRQFSRFDWEREQTKQKCLIRIVDWLRFYSFEYIGNALRLVVTPLTDRCYITLTQALNLIMGGAPAGPAGTGKTETVKDLGRAVGLPVMVFNCSDQMNKDSMAQIFMGLSQSGAWGCFDEFNRISIEVLSVVSTQVKTCLDAQKEKKRKFVFLEEGEISLEDTAGFFITMNPGYAGRTELPENLKALFRSCAMVVPDIILICENMLMSEGFVQARELSKKFVCLYNLSKELLSKQRHYDWGLRAVKSVLRQAGGLKRADMEIAEDPLLMRALRDFNLPKIVTDDKPIFIRLINDLFPGCDAPYKQNAHLAKLCKDAAEQHMGLYFEENFIKKCIEMAEIQEVRHCMFVIGPPGSGKTCVWRTLLKAHQLDGEDSEHDTLNPKALTNDELFGCYTKTKEWKNGVLSTILRSQTKCEEKYKESQLHKWTILDGDVDPGWIESCNTVMDDNKVLTLVSNDRIPLSPSMRLLFEVSNLRNATPATVSRGGVLFINETDIGWMPLVNSWLDRTQLYMQPSETGQNVPYSKLDENAKTVFMRCFQTYIDQPGDIHDPNKMITIAPTQLIGLVEVLTTLLDSLLIEHSPTIARLKESGTQDEDLKVLYEAFFIFAGMWAFGSSIGGGQDDEALVKTFNGIWRSYAKVKFPDQNYCYDYYWSAEEMKWASWAGRVQPYEAPEEMVFSKIYVNTIQTIRMKYMLSVHLARRKPILFIGGAGTGKTSLVRDFLGTTKPEQVSYKTINFSSFTDAISLQGQIESMLEKKSGKTYGSATNKILITFIDDLNMPRVDTYGTQSPIQLLRQIIDYASIFNLEQLEERKYIQDLLFFAALNYKSGSFTVDMRLQKNFTVFAQNTPGQDVIRTIFGSILSAFLSNPGWENKITAMSEKLIDSTIYIFQKLLKNNQFSPSAKKFHYQFNYRELAKVVEGMMRSNPSAYKTPLQMQRLWNHENTRVFEDRFINDDDINVFRVYLREGLVKNFGDFNEKENPFEEPCLFTTFIADHRGQEPNYLPVSSSDELKEVLTEKLEEYNDVKPQMNLVLFNQAMEHVCKICRIITLMNGNALLVGVGGSGKQSLGRLSVFINGYEFEQMLVTQQFNMNDLRSYLSDMYRKIAKPNSNARVFVLNDSQIKEESFLIPINDMLNSGWISDLFTKEDFEGLVNNLRNEAKSTGVADNNEALSLYFLEKMRKNLKVVLCFSPVGDAMRVRSRKFPGIINSTSVDWFHPWPKYALIDVASRFLEETELEPELLDKIALNMAETHVSIDKANEMYRKLERRNNYTTPKSFLELISFYKELLTKKRNAIESQIQRYQNGLQILDETKSQVEGLQEELKIKLVEVEKQKVETDILIEKVSYQNAIAEEEQAKANIEEEKTNEKSEEAAKLKETCQIALQKAIPILEQAKEAVNCLQKPAITEMKNLAKPPQGVIYTARVVLILLGEKVSFSEPDEKFWPKAQNAMNNPERFLQRVKDFNGQFIEQTIIDGANKIIADPSKNYNEKDMVKQSFAASKLCAWSVNIMTFNRVFKEVDPLQQAERKASDELSIAQKELARVKEEVRKLNEKVDALKKQLNDAQEQKRIVEEDATNCMNKLSAAEKLVNGLSGENKRWSENVAFLLSNKMSIIGDVLLASEFVSYIGAFSAKIRNNLWKNIWLNDIKSKEIPLTEDIEPLKILTNEAIKSKWKIEGLPADSMSLENASIISSCARWPLLIDPQLQGSAWIKGANAEKLSIINIGQKNWMRELTRCINEGRTVLMEGIQEEIDATLEPLLTRSINKKAGWTIDLAGEIIDYDKEFKLFLMTKMFNPHFRPEIAAQCTIINFIVTESGLEEQLLASVVNVEKNELEVQKQELVKMQNEFQVELDRLESELLSELSKADASTILENKELIEKLDNTKKTAINIQKQSDEAKITEVKINTEREIYRPVAIEGSMLYFLIISLCIVDHMYQYSLESFTNFFFKAINKVDERDDTRIGKLVESIRITIYQWVSRGLFERHKLIFLSLIMFRLMQKKIVDVQYSPEEMDFLIKGVPRPGYENNLEWLPNTAWDMVQAMVVLEEFKPFAQNMEKDAPNRFKDWYNELAPEDVKLPLDWKRLDSLPFKKLLVIRCLRPDRITVALTRFIREIMPRGDEFVDMDSKLSFVDVLANSIDDSDPSIPIFFILSPGADPVKEVEKIIKRDRDRYRIEVGKSFFNIALGQGQDEIARRRIEEGNKEGHWIMLQNIHLMPRWLIELEKILDGYKGDGNSNPGFRLLLSAEPSDGVPIGILDRSIKLTNEPPSGLKANMKRAFTFFPKEEIDDKDNKVKCILFGLCYFHSTVIERRRFGAKGWNMSYPFNTGDLRDSYLVLNRYMESNSGSSKVPFEDIIYIFGDIMYGGHIVDDWDRRLARAYLENIMTNEIFEEEELFPFIDGKNISFRVPAPTNHESYLQHIDSSLQHETPLAYGLHPNAEIGFRTTQCLNLFYTLTEIQPKDENAADGAGVKTNQEILQDLIRRFFDDLSIKGMIFNVDEIKNKIDLEQKGPYQNVFIQEIEYMTILLIEIVKSLEEIDQGLKGNLTISEKMEQTMDALVLNRVPSSWSVLSYPSKRGLESWVVNLIKRIEQLNLFRDDPLNLPKVIMISRFFNPQSYLTAIKQVVAANAKGQGLELNKLYIQTDITKKSIEEIDSVPKDGAYVFGFVLEGARWDSAIGMLDESKPKEMFSVIPVVFCRAAILPPEGKEDKSLYQCPSYKTEDRSATYVFTAQLKTKVNPRKWTLAGVAIIMDVEGISDESTAAKKK